MLAEAILGQLVGYSSSRRGDTSGCHSPKWMCLCAPTRFLFLFPGEHPRAHTARRNLEEFPSLSHSSSLCLFQCAASWLVSPVSAFPSCRALTCSAVIHHSSCCLGWEVQLDSTALPQPWPLFCCSPGEGDTGLVSWRFCILPLLCRLPLDSNSFPYCCPDHPSLARIFFFFQSTSLSVESAVTLLSLDHALSCFVI